VDGILRDIVDTPEWRVPRWTWLNSPIMAGPKASTSSGRKLAAHLRTRASIIEFELTSGSNVRVGCLALDSLPRHRSCGFSRKRSTAGYNRLTRSFVVGGRGFEPLTSDPFRVNERRRCSRGVGRGRAVSVDARSFAAFVLVTRGSAVRRVGSDVNLFRVVCSSRRSAQAGWMATFVATLIRYFLDPFPHDGSGRCRTHHHVRSDFTNREQPGRGEAARRRWCEPTVRRTLMLRSLSQPIRRAKSAGPQLKPTLSMVRVAVALGGVVMLLVGAGCAQGDDGPREVSLARLVNEQEAYDGEVVRTEGVVRSFGREPAVEYWLEDACANRVGLVPIRRVAPLVGVDVIVVGRFTFESAHGRTISADSIENAGDQPPPCAAPEGSADATHRRPVASG
jgi:hypothetical protein